MLKHENSDWREKLATHAVALGLPVLPQNKAHEATMPALKTPGVMKHMVPADGKGGKPGVF